MQSGSHHRNSLHLSVVWIARITGSIIIALLMLMLFGESGSGPEGIRQWVYLALFPCAFSIGYIIAWWRPFIGGWVSVIAMVTSLIVVGQLFPFRMYTVWASLCMPGVLHILAGLAQRRDLGTSAESRDS